MTLRIRLTVALAIAAVLLFVVHGIYQVRAERKDLRASIEREVMMLGRSVQVAVENALRDRQLPDVSETLGQLERIDPGVDILVLDPLRRVIARSEGSRPGEPFQDLVVDRVLEGGAPQLRYDLAGPERVVLGLPLAGETGALLGCVLIVRPLADMQRDLAATTNQIVFVGAILALVITALGVALSTIYVSRPLAALLAGMQRFRRGELESELEVGRRGDEVAALLREFNQMVRDLAEARRRLVEEGEARLRVERGLQRVDKMVTIGQLAAGLAHEIGSPLQVMRGRARNLRERAHDASQTARNAGILVEQVDRISGIVEQLLHFARRQVPAKTSFDIVTCVRGVCELVAPEAQRRGVALELTADPEAVTVRANSDAIQQVVLNLVMNALAATPAGGRIDVEVRAGTVPASGSTVSDGPSGISQVVRFTVTDTGVGIAGDLRPFLFEPFFTTRVEEGGTGLGLAVVRSIVQAHDGTVTFESQPDVGSTFTVQLPLADHAEQEPAS